MERARDDDQGRDRRTDAPSRVRRALSCPYCRDEVSRSGAVACARDGCGALYHRECFDEVRAGYGGCAIYGCGSREAREVTALGWLVKVVRLLLAALLFSSRVATRARRQRDGAERGPGRSRLRRALDAFRPSVRRRGGRQSPRFVARELETSRRIAERLGLPVAQVHRRRVRRRQARYVAREERIAARAGVPAGWARLARVASPVFWGVYLFTSVLAVTFTSMEVNPILWWFDLEAGPFANASPELGCVLVMAASFAIVLLGAALAGVLLHVLGQSVPGLASALREERAALARAEAGTWLTVLRRGGRDGCKSTSRS